MTHVRSSARFPRISLARFTRYAYAYIHIYIHAYAHSNPPFSPVDIDGDHNAETNRVPRRIYMHAIRCARISISIDICLARGLRSTGPGRRDRPHCPLDEHCAPALERPASLFSRFSLLSFYLFACVSVIFSFRMPNDRTGGEREGGGRRRK